MRPATTALVLGVLAFGLAGCGRKPGSSESDWRPATFKGLLGTWVRDDGNALSILKDGRGSLTSFGDIRVAQAGANFSLFGLSRKGAFRCVYEVATAGGEALRWRLVSQPNKLCPEGDFRKSTP